MEFQDPGFNGLCCVVALPNYQSPLFANVSSLLFRNGDWVVPTSPTNPKTTIFLLDGNGLIGMYDSASASAVPEPAIWLMLILGFGTVGLMMRVSRRHQYPIA
jgi:hypothetical protein